MLYVGPTCWVFLTNKNVGTTKMLENVVCCVVWEFLEMLYVVCWCGVFENSHL